MSMLILIVNGIEICCMSWVYLLFYMLMKFGDWIWKIVVVGIENQVIDSYMLLCVKKFMLIIWYEGFWVYSM